MDMLKLIALGQGPTNALMFLGHSGWGPGQLEIELSQGAWIPATMRLDLVFDVPVEDRWKNALQVEGLHPGQFSTSRP